jgi:hypothetical protein
MPPAFLIGAGIAQLFNKLYGAAEQAMEAWVLFLRQTPPRVTVETSQSSGQIPASKQVTEFTEAYHQMYSRATYVKSLAFGQRTWTEVTRERKIVCV